MAYTVNDSTDLEMTRYNEAADIKQYSGASVENVRGGYVQHDPIRKVEGVYIDLPSGGKLRVGDRPVTPKQMVQTDVLAQAQAPDPVAEVSTSPIPANGRFPIESLMGKGDAVDTVPMEDYLAAGYTEAEGLQYEKYKQDKLIASGKNVLYAGQPLTPDQMAEYAKQPGAQMVMPKDTSIAENMQSGIYNTLDPNREQTGGVMDTVSSVLQDLIGKENLTPSMLSQISGDLTQFADFFAPGIGGAMSVDEGTTLIDSGYSMMKNGLAQGDTGMAVSGLIDATLGSVFTTLGVVELVPMVKGLTKPARELLGQASPAMKARVADLIGASRAIAQGDKDMLMEIFQPAGTPRSLGAATPTDLETAPAFTPEIMARLVPAPEMAVVARDVPVENVTGVAQQIARQKSAFEPTNGWAGMVVAKVTPKKDKFEVTYQETPYNFDKPPEGVSPNAWQSTMVQRQVEEIRALADRVKANDPKAIAIVKEANWYRAMRASLRKEFGGMGDVFADVLGATSAQTGVEMNWNNAIEVMRRFSRGEFDEEIRMYDEMLKKGDVNPTTLGQMHNDPENPFRLITNAAGSLFNANSPAATKALFDMFRVATGAPKTPNFTGNLIGYTNAATIDVWAARHLRRLAGLDRLPPPVEKGVVGKHLVGSTLEQPNVSGEFGFGQRVMAAAAEEINKQGIISSVAPNLQAMNPDDLQAVAWFIEKEKWTENGWTSKAGEGGSFEFESSLAGAADPALAKTLRRRVTESFKPPMMRKKETDAAYAARIEPLRIAHVAGAAEAQKQLDAIKAPLARYVLGISVERPGLRPTNVQQADVAARLGEPAKADPSVVTYQINNTYGRFMQSDERAFNAEFVVRQNFNPEGVTRRMVEVAKEADQDAAFISKVVPARTAESRPGVEIYFRKRQDPDFARRLSDKLTQYGVDGFTFVTDSRVMDRPSAQAGLATEAVAGINGLRFQYIPEFDMGADAWAAMSPAEKAKKIDDVEDLFESIVNNIITTEPDVSAVNLMNYETNVIGKGQYDEYLK